MLNEALKIRLHTYAMLESDMNRMHTDCFGGGSKISNWYIAEKAQGRGVHT